MPKPLSNEYGAFYTNYVLLVNATDVTNAFDDQQPTIDNFFDAITEEQSNFAYAPGKWNIKEVVQHLIDAERIFTYRSLCIARSETQSLPGFDENLYATHSNANNRSWESLCKELKLVRESSRMLYESFSNQTIALVGLANNSSISVNAIAFIIVGHLQHHINVLNERYLISN